MYELDNETFSYEELVKAAEDKGYTIDELFAKNPNLKKVEDTAGKPTSQGQGAPVAETAAPEVQAESTDSTLEDGSLELEEISLKEKKKLPYNIRQQLNREQNFTVKRVNELTKGFNKIKQDDIIPVVKEGKMLKKELDRASELNDIIRGNSKDERLILNNIPDTDQQVKMIQELQKDAKQELELIKKRNPGVLEALDQVKKDTEAYSADSASTDIFKVFSFGAAKNEEANETLNLNSEIQTEIINTLKNKNIPLEKAGQGRLSLEEKENIINTSKINVLNRVIEEESNAYAQTYSKKTEQLKLLNSQIDAIKPTDQKAIDYKNQLVNKYNNLLNKTKLESKDFMSNMQNLQSKYVIESGGKVLKNFAKSKEKEKEGEKLDVSPNLNAFYTFSNEMYSMAKKGAVGIPSMILKTADAITEAITGEDKYSYIDAFTDQLNAFASSGLGLPQSDNFKIVDEKGDYDFTRANAINTFAQALPFSLLIMAEAAKGNLNGATQMLSKAYKGGKFLTSGVKQDLLLAQGAFKATISDNIKEGEDAGLSKLQALAYGNLTSIGEGVVQSIMPDTQLVKAGTNAVKAGLFNSLKNAANKKAISNAAQTYFTNIGKEIFEEEAMLGLSDLIKITSGISTEENGFTDIIAQKNLAASTVILSGGLGSMGAKADFKRTKDLIYKDVIKQSNGVLDALKMQIATLPRAENNEVLPEYVEQEKALQEARIFATDLVRASKIAPENVSSDQLDLLIEKQKLIDKKSKLDTSFHGPINEEIAVIDKKISESTVTKTKLETETKLIEGSKKLAQELGVKISDKFENVDEINDYLKSINSKEKFSNQYGSFFTNKETGQNEIIINRAAALKDGIITTDAHELFHAVLLETVKGNPEAQQKLGAALYGELLKIDNDQVASSEFNSRLIGYLELASENKLSTGDAMEEALTLFSEATLNGDIKFEENLFTKIGDFLRQTFTKAGVAAKFNNGRDVYNFIKDYNKSLLKNKLSEKVIATAKSGATGKLVTKEKNNVSTKESDSKYSLANNVPQTQINASKKAQELYEKVVINEAIPERNRNKAKADIVSLFEPSVDRIVNKYRNRPGFNQMKEDLTYELLYGKSGVLDMVNKYDPKINDSLGAYINTYLERRAITISDKLLGKNEASTFKSDVTEAKDIMATETSEDAINVSEEIAKEKPAKKKAKLKETIKLDKGLNEKLAEALTKAIALNVKKFDAIKGQNQTIAPFVADVKIDLSDLLEKDLVKLIKNQGVENFLISNRETLLDNLTTTFLSKHPFFRKGILKRVNGEWVAPTKLSAYKYDWIDLKGNKLKIDRDNASGRGLTSGPEFIKRNPKIKEILKENEFVDYHFQDGALRNKIKTNPVNSVARQIAAEYGLEVLQEDLLLQGPLTKAISERADLYGIVVAKVELDQTVKDIDRGLIKFSNKISINKLTELVVDSRLIAAEYGLDSSEYNDHIKDLKENGEYIDNIVQGNLGVLELMQKIAIKNKGLKYEKAIKKIIAAVIKRTNAPKFKITIVNDPTQGSFSSKGKGDLSLTIADIIANFELKLNGLSQTGSFTVGNIEGKGDIETTNKNLTFKKEIQEVIKGEDYKKAILNFKENAKKELIKQGFDPKDYDTSKFPTDLPSSVMDNLPKNEFNFDIPLSNLNEVVTFYTEKGVNYMQIGDLGLFLIGEDVLGLGPLAPMLRGKGKIRVRMQHSNKKNGIKSQRIRAFYNFTEINSENVQLNLDKAEDIKKMIDIGIANKEYAESIKPTSKSSLAMNTTFNEMLERKKGVLATETISQATAKLTGEKKGKLKLFVPPSADDLLGMLYNFAGSGKQGDADLKFFDNKLLRPLARANFQLNKERQLIKQGYYNLIKANKGITKKLRKESDYKYYTNDAAVRVYMWTKMGYEIPGINASDKAALIKAVKADPKLLQFAEDLITVPNKTESWLKPEDDWTASTIESDLQDILSKIGRARIFEEYITNANIIFSKDNLNKIEAAYGPALRSALDDMLYRIEKGRARGTGDNKQANAYLNWVRGSVATTMFFNVRSALLQQLSIVNFTNWEDNNIYAQGKFIAGSPKEYAKYWVDIFNSDWMKERRQGLKTDINEAELVARLEGSKNKNKALLAYILEKGFSLTKYGDNIAIATGGAPFLYNREQKYIKEGMTEAKAKEEAFLDFQEIAERTQQSSRQDLLSNQQVSVIGRIFLAFQNTTMQMTRIQKKAALDLINRRGNTKANIARLVYYSAIQNTLFSYLQNALFVSLFSDDEEDDLKIDDKTMRAANTVLDSALRGSGIAGAVVATLKNALIVWMRENDKGYNARSGKVIIELLNLSPAIGIKARKIYGSMESNRYNKKIIDNIGYDNPNHPYYGIVGNLTAAAFNIPLDRIVTKAQNIKAMTQQDAEAWQRTALFLGYNAWNLGLEDPEIKAAKGKKKGFKSDFKSQFKDEFKNEFK